MERSDVEVLCILVALLVGFPLASAAFAGKYLNGKQEDDPCEYFLPILLACIGLFIGLIVVSVLGSAAVIVASVVWTAIWLALKLVAVGVFMPPALVLSVFCSVHGPEEAVMEVVWLKWTCVLPARKAKPAAQEEDQQTAAANPRASLSSAHSQDPPDYTPQGNRCGVGGSRTRSDQVRGATRYGYRGLDPRR
ncbi:hypothetical protein PG994_008644 [Apiospora phragmitis]|uniref:Uncharacterized protein n=1 Tax=Apiospora phragmitis TaxID=2905665 RepID=A0ABR1UH15_9PEZI